MDLIFRSKPVSSDGAGRPSLETQDEGGQVFPASERGWKSFRVRESDEKQIRTRSFWAAGAVRTLAESFRRTSLRVLRDLERDQKQVTMVREPRVERREASW